MIAVVVMVVVTLCDGERNCGCREWSKDAGYEPLEDEMCLAGERDRNGRAMGRWWEQRAVQRTVRERRRGEGDGEE